MTTFNNIIETAKANGLNVRVQLRGDGKNEYEFFVNYIDSRKEKTTVHYIYLDGKTEFLISLDKYNYSKQTVRDFKETLKHLKRMLKK